jgi:hypothetical protein
MRVAIVLAWMLVPLSLWISIGLTKVSVVWSSLGILVAIAFAAYLLFVTKRWERDSQMCFEVELGGKVIKLISYDELEKRRVTQNISLNDVLTAEYFEPRDTACLVLLDRDKNTVEIPLWPFGPEAERQIVDYVRACGIKLIGNPNPMD